MKRILRNQIPAVLLTLCMVITLLPGTALALNATATLTVNGTALVTGGAVVSGASVTGASYDADSNTLTLTNFTGTSVSAVNMGGTFKLSLAGDSSLVNEAENGCALSITKGDGNVAVVTINGTEGATLTVRSGAQSGATQPAAIFSDTDVVIDGVQVDVLPVQNSVGIHTEESLTLRNGAVLTLSAGDATVTSLGTRIETGASGNVTVSGGSAVEAHAKGTGTAAIVVGGMFSMSDGSGVAVTSEADGISADSVTIDSTNYCNVEITAAEDKAAIVANSTPTITGIIIKAAGNHYKIEEGTVIKQGATAATAEYATSLTWSNNESAPYLKLEKLNKYESVDLQEAYAGQPVLLDTAFMTYPPYYETDFVDLFKPLFGNKVFITDPAETADVSRTALWSDIPANDETYTRYEFTDTSAAVPDAATPFAVFDFTFGGTSGYNYATYGGDYTMTFQPGMPGVGMHMESETLIDAMDTIVEDGDVTIIVLSRYRDTWIRLHAISSIEVTTDPTTVSYTSGDALNLAGMTVTVTYDDGATKLITPTDFAAYGLTVSPAGGAALTDASSGQKLTVSSNTPGVATAFSKGTLRVGRGNNSGYNPQTIYRTTEGAGGTWTQGAAVGYSFTFDAPFNRFLSVRVDGCAIAASSYTAASGSTIITLNPAYLETLSAGTHTLRAVFSDGYAQTAFTIADKTNPDTGAWDNPFTDVSESDWFYEDVAVCHMLNLMKGTSDTTFSPYAITTRGIIVTILWRLESEPVVNYAMIFEDVPADRYYTEAVRWAASEGILDGHSATAFGPDDVVTREQLATILYRYEQYKGGGFVGSRYFLLDFSDAADVSDLADEAMHWCVMNGIIQGSDGKLSPKDGAQRCQAAAMLIRYLNAMKR